MLDDKDKILLAALRKNARESLVSLARSAGLSRSATQERLRRLERNRVIRAYTIEIASQEDPAVRAMIAITLQPGRACEQIVPRISGLPQVEGCHSTAGAIDLMLMVSCGSNAALDRVRETVASVPGVATAVTHVILSTHWE